MEQPSPNPLTNLSEKVLKHWQEFQPAKVRAFRQSGDLGSAVKEAVQATKEAYAQAIEAGMSVDQAWESVRELWAFPPEETSEPSPPLRLVQPTT